MNSAVQLYTPSALRSTLLRAAPHAAISFSRVPCTYPGPHTIGLRDNPRATLRRPTRCLFLSSRFPYAALASSPPRAHHRTTPRHSTHHRALLHTTPHTTPHAASLPSIPSYSLPTSSFPTGRAPQSVALAPPHCHTCALCVLLSAPRHRFGHTLEHTTSNTRDAGVRGHGARRRDAWTAVPGTRTQAAV